MKIYWTPEAKQDRLAIIEYIAAEDLRAAKRMNKLFGETAAKLARFPNRGRLGSIPGTRELLPP